MAGEITKDQMAKWVETAPMKRLGNALVQLFERQTDDEQTAETTKYHNNIGFNACDAEILTNIAKWFMAKGWMSNKQTALVRKRIKKYSGQLADIANQMKGGEGSGTNEKVTSA